MPDAPERQLSQADRPCSRCRCPLKFAENASTHKTVPLDLRSPTYLVFRRADGSEFCWSAKEFVERNGGQVVRVAPPGAETPEPIVLVGIHVSHFASCPFANQFSGQKAAKGTS